MGRKGFNIGSTNIKGSLMFTVRELRERLAAAVNQDAVVCLCVDEFVYSAFEDTIDECAKHGSDNCFLLTLEPKSEIAEFLGTRGQGYVARVVHLGG